MTLSRLPIIRKYSPAAWGLILLGVLFVMGVVLIGGLVAVSAKVSAQNDDIIDIGVQLVQIGKDQNATLDLIKDCTSAEDTECRRQGDAQIQAASRLIRDGNENGIPDTVEILEALHRIENR